MRKLITIGRFTQQKETFLSGWGSPVHTILTAANIQTIHDAQVSFPGLYLLAKKIKLHFLDCIFQVRLSGPNSCLTSSFLPVQ